MEMILNFFKLLFGLFDSLHLINNLSVIKGWVFLGWTSFKLGVMCLAQGHRAQHSDAGEARTHGRLVSSQALYHWATALPSSKDIFDIGTEQFKQYLVSLLAW